MAKKKKPKNYHVTPTGAVGRNTAQGMLALAPQPGYHAQAGQVVPVPQLPLDPAQEAAKVSNQRNLGISEATSVYDTGQIENEYGLGADKSNPYSRAKLLEDSYKRSQRGTLNSMASMGQLYSGAYGRAQRENTRNYNIAYDQLSRDYTGKLRGVQQGRLLAYGQYGSDEDEAAFQALLRAYRGG